MASSMILKKISKPWCSSLTFFRNAYYPDWHLTPIQSKDELNKLEAENKLHALKVIPVKPAPIDMTNSLFDDPMVNKFQKIVMQWSDRALARKLLDETFARIKRIQLSKYHSAPDDEKSSIELDPKKILLSAIQNCKPVLITMPIKKGGITYQVPMPVTDHRSRFISMKWLVMAARDKEGPVSFVEQLSRELLDAYNNEGRVVRRKQDLHKLCETNKAYAHYRWS